MDIVKTKLFISITDKDKTNRIIRLFKRHNVTYSCSVN